MQSGDPRKFILNFTPTGMIPTREMTPHVPLKPAEIVQEVLDMAELGVNMVHLHARENGSEQPTFRKEVYAEIIAGIRRYQPDLVVGVSTSGRTHNEFAKRSEALELNSGLKPDFGSLTLSSLNFNKQASINPPETIRGLAAKMKTNSIRPEMEVFDLGMINYANYLIRKGLITPPFYFNLILGNIACAQAEMLSLGLMIKELPPGSIWSVGGIGHAQLEMNAMALVAGGGVRVGLEDNIWFDRERSTLATNRALVERILSIAKTLGREPYSQQEAREVLGVA